MHCSPRFWCKLRRRVDNRRGERNVGFARAGRRFPRLPEEPAPRARQYHRKNERRSKRWAKDRISEKRRIHDGLGRGKVSKFSDVGTPKPLRLAPDQVVFFFDPPAEEISARRNEKEPFLSSIIGKEVQPRSTPNLGVARGRILQRVMLRTTLVSRSRTYLIA